MTTDTQKQEVKKCLNCGTEYIGAYCHSCGQHCSTGRLMPRTFFIDMCASLTRINRGFLYTAGLLAVAPWRVIRDYIHGHRVRYVAPVQMLIVLCLIGTLLSGLIDESATEKVKSLELLDADLRGAAVVNSIARMYFGSWIAQYLTIFLPCVLAARVVYRRCGARRFNIAEYAVAMIYMSDAMLVVSIVLCPLGRIYPALDTLASGLYMCVVGAIVMVKAFPQPDMWRTVVKIAAMIALSALVLILPACVLGVIVGLLVA